MLRPLVRYSFISAFCIISLFLGFVYFESHHTAEPINWNSDNVLTDNSDNRKKEEQLPIVTPTVIPSSHNTETLSFINHDVPFTSQAPKGNWDDERQQDGCEETSALMAMLWVRNKTITAKQAETEILALSDYEQAIYGEFRDITLEDIKKWIFNDYFKYNNVSIEMNITPNSIITVLRNGGVVLVPMNGQKLHNPYFTAPGPERHMLLIRGYDPGTKEFITNDPGTKRGENYRYSEATIIEAILVYPTGHHEPADENLKGMIVVKK